jgi:hypothetical protein
MFELFAILVIAAVLRLAIILKYKFLGTDTFYHLIRSSAIRKNGRIKELEGKIAKIKELLVTPRWWIYYPPFFDIFLSFFSENQHKYLKYFPTFFDILVMIFLYIFVNDLFGNTIAMLSLLTYGLSPIMVLVSISISPRTFANLFFVLSNIFLLSYFITTNILFILLSSFCITIICLSHKLTLQSSIIVFLAESLVLRTFIPFISLLLGFLIAILITKGFYFNIFRVHMELLLDFFKKKPNYNKKIKELAYTIASFPFITLLFLNTYLGSNIIIYFQVWFWSLFVVALLWMWGDSYRYMTNAIFPGSILVALTLTKIQFNILFLFSAIFSFLVIMKIYSIFKKPPKVIDNNLLSCFNFIKTHGKKNQLIITIPPQYHLAASYFTKALTLEMTEKEFKSALIKGKVLNRKIIWVVSASKISSKHLKKSINFCNFIVYKFV